MNTFNESNAREFASVVKCGDFVAVDYVRECERELNAMAKKKGYRLFDLSQNLCYYGDYTKQVIDKSKVGTRKPIYKTKVKNVLKEHIENGTQYLCWYNENDLKARGGKSTHTYTATLNGKPIKVDNELLKEILTPSSYEKMVNHNYGASNTKHPYCTYKTTGILYIKSGDFEWRA